MLTSHEAGGNKNIGYTGAEPTFKNSSGDGRSQRYLEPSNEGLPVGAIGYWAQVPVCFSKCSRR